MRIEFNSFNLHPQLVKAGQALGYSEPMPIQTAVIPLLLDGQDVIGQAQTGTGKTAAFALPMLQNLLDGQRSVQGLVMAPTRELALQVAGAITDFGRERRVLLCELRGQLLSPGAPPATLDGHVEDLLRLLEALDLASVDVLGASFGALVGLTLAARNPRPRPDSHGTCSIRASCRRGSSRTRSSSVCARSIPTDWGSSSERSHKGARTDMKQDVTFANPRVLDFYKELPFNYQASAEDQAKVVRAQDSVSAYPVLTRLLKKNTRVLEVGCGAGWLSNSIAYHYRAQVTAIDFNPAAVEVRLRLERGQNPEVALSIPPVRVSHAGPDRVGIDMPPRSLVMVRWNTVERDAWTCAGGGSHEQLPTSSSGRESSLRATATS